MLRSLYKSIFSPFTKLEQKLLEILLSGFDGEARRLLEAQLRDVNKVGRERQGKEVILYRLRWFHVYRDPRLSFPVGEEVVRFARVSFSSVSTGRLTADFFITRGFFSIMEFSKTPPKIRAAEEIEHAALKVLRNPLEISGMKMFSHSTGDMVNSVHMSFSTGMPIRRSSPAKWNGTRNS